MEGVKCARRPGIKRCTHRRSGKSRLVPDLVEFNSALVMREQRRQIIRPISHVRRFGGATEHPISAGLRRTRRSPGGRDPTDSLDHLSTVG